jgi:hypothetical protein
MFILNIINESINLLKKKNNNNNNNSRLFIGRNQIHALHVLL